MGVFRCAVAMGVTRAPDLAIIIPVWKQPGFLHESVSSALAQKADFPIAVVIVNDGCPMPETDATGRMLARAHPGRVFYLRRPNGGLSAARNSGIDFALARWPDLRAVFPLDADNLLRPHAMAHALAALDAARRADPRIGWVYPDIDMFGDPVSTDHGGAYSVLLHSCANICEAGSLISRALLEAGPRYDETLRQGWEDWDFWLSAAEAGFRGQHLPDFGFCYRRRRESMLAQTAPMEAHLYQSLVSRHKALFSPRNLVALEHEEAPRFARLTTDGQIELATDPGFPLARITLTEYARRYRATRGTGSRNMIPAFLLAMPDALLLHLRKRKTLYAVLRRLEKTARTEGIARLAFPAGMAVMMREDMAMDETQTPFFQAIIHAIKARSPDQAEDWSWDWRMPALPWRMQMQEIARRAVGGHVLSAHLPDDAPGLLIEAEQARAPDAGLMRAIGDFSKGAPLHLAILGDMKIPVARELSALACRITHLPEDDPADIAAALATLERILVTLPPADGPLLSQIKQAGPAITLYAAGGADPAEVADIAHVLTQIIVPISGQADRLAAQGLSRDEIRVLPTAPQ